MTTEKTYILQDTQEATHFHEVTLDEAKGFLLDCWNEDDFEDEEDPEAAFQEFEDAVLESDFNEMQDRLGGIGYILFEK